VINPPKRALEMRYQLLQAGQEGRILNVEAIAETEHGSSEKDWRACSVPTWTIIVRRCRQG